MIDKDKEPRHDGFPVRYFHHFWDIIREDRVKAIQEFQRHNSLLKS